MSRNINIDLRSLANWLKANKIALNIKKTEFVLFKRPTVKISDYPCIKMDGKKIYPSKQIKYLGVFIDEHLSWNYHINQLSMKLSRANGMLAKIRHFVNPELLKTIYHAILSSHMRYGCIVWGQKGSSLCTNICNLQNTALRIMFFAKLFDRTKPLFNLAGILQFSDMVILENIIFSHSFLSYYLPSSFREFFTLTKEAHNYETKRTKNVFFYVERVNTTKFGLNSIKYLCVKSWNLLLLRYPAIDFLNIKKLALVKLVKHEFINFYKD